MLAGWTVKINPGPALNAEAQKSSMEAWVDFGPSGA
jgi:hypothetical protein